MATANEPLLLADHPVLDFLNTARMVDGALTEFLTTDKDVLRWLAAQGHARTLPKNAAAGALQAQAIALREAIRKAVTHRKSGKSIDTRAWNTRLAQCASYLSIVMQEGALHAERRWLANTPDQLLAPILEEAVTLLLEDSFELVRPCEDEHCVLWFYDRTKSHRRRWCSPHTCGNRHKVAAYRERQKR